MDRLLSVVALAYNEKKALEEFYRGTTHVLEYANQDYKLLFVNNGSKDGSQDILDRMAASDSKVRVISFSRNFGHETAVMTGLGYSRGDGIVCMNTDLQHPPECIPDILAKFEEGYQVINMVRTKNGTTGLVKNITPSGFYWFINQILDVHFETSVSDFSAVSRHVAQVLENSYREEMRFLRGCVQNVGFKKTTIEYKARARVTGESRYSIKKLFMFSIDTILCFSNMPLELGICAGIFSALLDLVVMIYTLCTRKGAPSGYVTIVVLICFMSAMMFTIIGIIGGYIAIPFTKPKDRPVYTVDWMENTVQGESADQNK